MSCLGEPPPPTPVLFDFERDIVDPVADGIRLLGTVIICVVGAIIVIVTVPLWGPFWIVGRLTH